MNVQGHSGNEGVFHPFTQLNRSPSRSIALSSVDSVGDEDLPAAVPNQ